MDRSRSRSRSSRMIFDRRSSHTNSSSSSSSQRLATFAALASSALGLIVLVVVFSAVSASSREYHDENPDHLFNDLISSESRQHHQVKRAPQQQQQRPFRGRGGKTPFSLDEIVNNAYRSASWNGTWVSDTEYAYRNRAGLQLFSVVSGESRTLVPNSAMEGVFKYWLSPDQQYVLMAIRPQKLFRHSFIAVYDVYSVLNGQRIKLQPSEQVLNELSGGFGGGPGGPPGGGGGGGGGPLGGGPGGRGPPPQLPLLFATWSPTGHALAYVFSNNIFYRENPESRDVVITTTGIPGTVFNGITDWVYEEEVISDTRAMWFSPDGAYLAWMETNDTAVDVMPLEIYGQPGRLEFQYPIPTPLRYPKPGRTNPFVNVYAARVSRATALRRSPAPILLEPPQYFEDKEKIIYSVAWANNEEVSLTWENRHQNYSIVSVCDVNKASCRDSLVMTQSNGWMDLDDPPIFTKDGRQFAMPLSADGFTHVNVINRDTNQRVPITSGEMVVTKLYHWDEVNHLIYFKATREGAPGERHLYTVTDFESGRPGVVTCLSCEVTNSRGGACGYNSFSFSKDKTYYTMSCNGPHVPQEYLFQAPNKKVATLVTNAFLSNALNDKHLPKISNLDVKIAGGKYDAKVRLYLPHDFNERKKYPLLVNVYAGPNSQQVSDRFKLDWGTYLTTTEEVIYAVIDGRGSGYRGNDLLFEIYRNLGGPEVQDQIEVTKKLVELYSFIDRDNVAIWGWSYGGFVTLSALAEDADRDNIFKCGIAVAPVTFWALYDSIYTERYMGLPRPDDNLRGYRASDVTSKAAKFRNKKLLLVHGTADDNVHYQQTMMLTRALEENDVLFQQLSYPDENHGIVSLRPHFYHSLTNFILNTCFGRNEAL